MGLTYVIADLHGRLDLLERAIELIERDAGEQGGTFIVLGDFVDRGPQSCQIIGRLMAGPRKAGWCWVVLQGNHEQIMLDALAMPHLMEWWVRNGGGETLRSYGYVHGERLRPLKIPQAHLDWLAELPVYHEDERRIFVHAGVPFDVPVVEAKKDTLQWMLYSGYDPRGESAELMPDESHVSGKHIVHGHEQDAKHPLLKRHRTNLDSFAWLTGRLAIGVFDDTYPAPIRIMDAIGRPA